jgi:ribosomal protein S18 acetylase RimI-like enzyme
VQVERLRAAEVEAGADLLARAFSDDPLMTYLVPPREARLVLGAMCRDGASAGVMEGVWLDGRLVGVAVWLPPGADEPTLRRELTQLPQWARLAARRPQAVPRLLRADRTLDALHPPQSHWFLSLLGVEPAVQRRGIGGALVAAGLARRGALAVHLDTSRPENLPWYRRFGFEVTAEVHAVPGAPPSWGMLRSA